MVTQPTIVAGKAILIALVTAAAGCASDAGHPPIARITLSPTAIPAHDAFQTVVTLDGTKSADPLDDPSGSHPLAFQWTIDGDDFRLDNSRATQPAPKVEFRGERPPTITLTVTDADGLDASATVYLELTVR